MKLFNHHLKSIPSDQLLFPHDHCYSAPFVPIMAPFDAKLVIMVHCRMEGSVQNGI
jgi:hypothetical protein